MSQVTPEAVQYAFRLFLGREPDAEAVKYHLNSYSTVEEMRAAFISCDEFKLITDSWISVMQDIATSYWNLPPTVEVDVPPPVLDALLARVVEQWGGLAERDPYWAMLANDQYRAADTNDEVLSQLFETGVRPAALIELFERRTGVVAPTGTCFELGCGVGRVTAHLAKRFDRVIAADISMANLNICRQNMERLGIANVETMLLSSPRQLSELGPIDFFYSVIVLQHNPPPVQKYFLVEILKKISAGGACLFQTPTQSRTYSFSAESFLQSGETVFDMHGMPAHVILDLINDSGFRLRDFALDPLNSSFGSYTYFATENRSARVLGAA